MNTSVYYINDTCHDSSATEHTVVDSNRSVENIFYYSAISKLLEPYFLFVLLAIVLRLIGPRFYYIRSNRVLTKLKNKYKDTIYLFEGEINPGLFINYNHYFCGYKEDRGDDNDMVYLMCNQSFYAEIKSR